jgi:transcriptional regulator of acetoin/glycerol metabolism
MIQKFINSSYPINDKTPFFTMAEREKDIILHTLKECNGNKKLAARRLGISRNTLYLKLKKYQITTHSSLN